MHKSIKIRHDILCIVMGIIWRWENSIICLRWTFEEIPHKRIWVSGGVLFKGLGVQKDTQTPCWLRPWHEFSIWCYRYATGSSGWPPSSLERRQQCHRSVGHHDTPARPSTSGRDLSQTPRPAASSLATWLCLGRHPIQEREEEDERCVSTIELLLFKGMVQYSTSWQWHLKLKIHLNPFKIYPTFRNPSNLICISYHCQLKIWNKKGGLPVIPSI